MRRPPPKPAPRLPDDGIVRVGCERRRGGSVTLVYGLTAAERTELGGELRKRCGAGGTIKDEVVVLQGDHRDVVLAHLGALGRRAKRMGG